MEWWFQIVGDTIKLVNHIDWRKPWLGFNGLGWYDNRARVLDALTGRFTTPDPLAGRYPDQSPYAHCANNPVRNIDPTGMDIWMIDERGSIQSYEKTMDFDAVRIVDGQGNTMIGKDGSTRVWIIHKI